MSILTQSVTAPIANLLLTFICTDGTLTNCQIYEKNMLEPGATEYVSCEDTATFIAQRAQALQLHETIVFACTTKEEAEAVIQEITGGM